MEITNKEFEKYSMEFDVVSDLDYVYNNKTGEFDVPAVEWDGIYGTHWTEYVTEEQRSDALKEHDEHMNKWVLNYRLENERKEKERKQKEKELREMKTLGSQFPQLKQLLNSV